MYRSVQGSQNCLWNCRESKEREQETAVMLVLSPWREEAPYGSFTGVVWEATAAQEPASDLLTIWSPVKLPSINMYYKLHHLSGSYEITCESTHHQQHQLPIDWYGREMDWYGQGWQHSLTSYLRVFINRGVNCPSPCPLFKSQGPAKAPLPLLCIQPHVWIQVHSSQHPDNSSWAMQPRYQIAVYIL